VVSDGTNTITISENDLTVSNPPNFDLGSTLIARCQAPFESGSTLTIELIYRPNGEVITTVSGIPLTKPVNPSVVKVEGYHLLVDGEPFVIKGVCYSPIPPGEGVGYNWWENPSIYQYDFQMIREMGANTIRTYDSTKATEAALDAAYQNDLRVIMGYWVDHGADFSNQTLRQSITNQFLEMVQKWKDHPAVLMWAFGNEVGMNTAHKQHWYQLVSETTQAAHEIDPNHPVIVVEGDRLEDLGNPELGSDDASLPDLDGWGINSYRGISFGSLFSQYELRTEKPLILTEWGCDALDVRTMSEDQEMQASYVGNMWNEIEEHLWSAGGRCLGGTVFEWCDEWWKGLDSNTHDKTGQWSNPAYYDYEDGKKNMNEEWWGITSVSAGTYEKTPREAYYTLMSLWTENAPASFTLSLSPSSGTAAAGGSISSTAHVSPKGGYSNSVALTAENLPPGITINFENESGIPPFTATIVISVSPDVTDGIYSLAIVGTGEEGMEIISTYDLKVGNIPDFVQYSDAVLPPENAVIYVWSGKDYNGPPGVFDNSCSEVKPPEGDKCFKTTSGSNWDDAYGHHVNYAGWGVFYTGAPENVVDLSDYNYLKFWVKTTTDLNVEIELGNHSKRGVRVSSYGWDGTDTWQEIIIPKGDFTNADFTKVFGTFLVTVVEPSKTFYIDNVRWTV